MRTLGLRALLAAFSACVIAVSGQPVINTTYGWVSGVSTGGVSIFHSIPFAAPPVGSLRFAAPAPLTPWLGVRDVSGMPAMCPQLKLDGDLFFGSEDCLYVQVYVPEAAAAAAAAQGKSLPVMFWIFGGAWVLGDSSEFGWYDGSNLALSKGVIVVAANYRVGPFGFLALDALRQADADHSTGNMGLQDQTAALAWVRDNIGSFGGDASRVTIFGESAGGFSVCWHMVSQASAGLFSAAIMESGSCDSPQFFQPVDFAVNWNTEYASAIGCNASALNASALLSCLRGMSTEKVMKSLADWLNPSWPFTSTGETLFAHLASVMNLPKQVTPSALPALAPVFPWGAAIDGAATGLVGVPLALMQSGQFNKVPMIVGTNANEGTIFIPLFPLVVPGTSFPPSEADIPKMVEHALDMYPPAMVDNYTNWALSAYPASAFSDTWQRGATMLTHLFFSCAARRAVRALTAAGVPAFLYQFSHHLSFLDGLEYDVLGDYHTSEIDFVFRNQWPPVLHDFNANDWVLSDAMSSFWSNFAYTRNPNVGPSNVSIVWPAYDRVSDMNMQFQVPLNVTHGLLNSMCNMWDVIYSGLGPW